LWINVPERYGEGTEGILRDSNEITTCTSDQLLNIGAPLYKEESINEVKTVTWRITFSAYIGDNVAPIVLFCKDVNNPVYYGEEMNF